MTNNKVGFKHYKDRDGKNIKYYEWVSINYIDDNGNKASKKYTNSNYIVSGIEDAVKGNFIITYNDKFESAVIKSKENISNIHRIISIWFGNEIVEPVPRDLNFKDNHFDIVEENNNLNFEWSKNGHEIKIVNGKVIKDNLSAYELFEADEVYYNQTWKHLYNDFHITIYRSNIKSPQDILLEMEMEKQKQDNKVNYKGLDDIVKLLKGISEDNKNFVNSLDNKSKTHRYPLIYKLKERQDYKSVKEKFDEDVRSGECDYVLLVYNHEEDRFYREFFKTEEKNITILDIYNNKKI